MRAVTRTRIHALAAAVGSSLIALTAAQAYDNGRLPRSALARIYHPTLVLYLEKHAAASWNTMRLYFTQHGTDIYPGGSISAYRTFDEQVVAKRIYGANAATPGTSNHGWGLAVDLATTGMRGDLDRWGSQFGWAKRWSDASWEWWHIKYASGVWRERPDPGVSSRFPVLRRGSGGPGQDVVVKDVQRRLAHHHFPCRVTGSFGAKTEAALKAFQAFYGLRADGVVHEATWRKLRGPVKAHLPPNPGSVAGRGPLIPTTPSSPTGVPAPSLPAP